ncbi:hypothetical protein [Streptococcus macacae]|uniref:Tandem five-TM protein n=1 Tax=Streptococcus macacae NCTC 11558 TaxID=764298 RepID=G5JY90_9STRE|nr:hypothetical protein [Streptococcus macacae]EHJ51759.1 hypothetical protein STRMA_0151 [Streptococcus macacae NCTC 11558]SUN78004.1 Uncharacterised protein [Streptococcus macacae NCTC 11558]
MTMKKMQHLVVIGQYQLGQTLYLDTQQQKLFATDDKSGQSSLNYFVGTFLIVNAVVGYLGHIILFNQMSIKIVSLLVSQTAALLCAKVINIMIRKNQSLYEVELSIIETADFSKWFSKVKRLAWGTFLIVVIVYLFFNILFLVTGNFVILLLTFLCSIMIFLLSQSHILKRLFLKLSDLPLE